MTKILPAKEMQKISKKNNNEKAHREKNIKSIFISIQASANAGQYYTTTYLGGPEDSEIIKLFRDLGYRVDTMYEDDETIYEISWENDDEE